MEGEGGAKPGGGEPTPWRSIASAKVKAVDIGRTGGGWGGGGAGGIGGWVKSNVDGSPKVG